MNQNQGNNVVRMFASYHEMQASVQEAEAEYATAHAAIRKRLESIQAVIKDDGDELVKFADADLELAKSHVGRHGDLANSQAIMNAGQAVLEAVHRRNARMFGVTELDKRSQRFAAAQARRYAGPASSAVSRMEKK